MNMVAEGVKTAKVVMELADELRRRACPSPSRSTAVCHEGRTAAEAYRGLLPHRRGDKHEFEGVSSDASS